MMNVLWVELRWPLLAGQAAGAQQLRLVAGHQLHSFAIPGATVDAARRYRLAVAGVHLATRHGFVNIAGVR